MEEVTALAFWGQCEAGFSLCFLLWVLLYPTRLVIGGLQLFFTDAGKMPRVVRLVD
jgi:hypothetical protein